MKRGDKGWRWAVVRVVVSSLACTALLCASDWTRFRGPNGTGVSPEENLPTEISRDGALWSVKVEEGNSSPIVVDGRLYLTAHEGDERMVGERSPQLLELLLATDEGRRRLG